MKNEQLKHDGIGLLRELIAIPSISREEDDAASALYNWMTRHGLQPQRSRNNVWAIADGFNPKKQTILLNAHIDTVKPVSTWTQNPFEATITDDGKIIGLGSNDCGGGLVSLLMSFIALASTEQKYNLVFLATAEEEVSGANGMEHALTMLPEINLAIVGEPTGMQPAIAEKGLMVLDITACGKAGHAARNEGVNAIYEAMDDLSWLRNYKFKKVSDLLGPTTMQVTMIESGTAHNIVPDSCKMVVDVRTNELYTNEEVYDIICGNVKSDVKARSTRLSSSHIDSNHAIVRRCISLGRTTYGSPTLSDQALIKCPSLKIGPGESERSHTADEFIYISEIENAIDFYIQLLDGLEI